MVWVKVDDEYSFVQRINMDQVVAIDESPAEETEEGHSPHAVEIITTAPHSMYVEELPPGDRVQACPYVISFTGEAAESFLRQIENP